MLRTILTDVSSSNSLLSGLRNVASLQNFCGAAWSQQLPSVSSSQSYSTNVTWDEDFLVGKKEGRKHGLYKPRGYQWWYSNPNYDPSIPRPKYFVSPHAPEHLQGVNYWKVYEKHKPAVGRRRYHKKFVEWLTVRAEDWRRNYIQHKAERTREEKIVSLQEKEMARQQAWREYKLKLFEQAVQSSK